MKLSVSMDVTSHSLTGTVFSEQSIDYNFINIVSLPFGQYFGFSRWLRFENSRWQFIPVSKDVIGSKKVILKFYVLLSSLHRCKAVI